MDLASDGRVDVVVVGGGVAGFYGRAPGGGWNDFRSFDSVPNVDWRDDRVRLVDLTGVGLADLLRVNDPGFLWFPSRGEAGFGAAREVRSPGDDTPSPVIGSRGATHSVFLADLAGDGLADIVRIGNGEVRYWPNLGYGRIGPGVTMASSPQFAAPDRFESARLRFVDI